MPTLLNRLRSLGLFRIARQRVMAVETVPGYNRLMALDDAALAELGLRREDIEAWGAGRILCVRPFTEQLRRFLEEPDAVPPLPPRDTVLPHSTA